MNRAAITVENLSKVYHIGLKEDRADTLVGALHGLVRAPVKNFRRLSRMNTFKHQDDANDIFWALRDVNFEVAEGEVVGIIGRNGAGKSTLLKILSRITEPTSGRAVIRGRVSSLLEVGTGFHQELTGRENVYMNGTILGMTKREIDEKFDEIVDFSGVEKFLDTPIKHYSSGMKVRLAFSVAAHLEPEILIIDEVLAVGDLEFQRKCLGKMRNVASCGRTVLFVSHNMSAVRSLCSTCAVFDRGRLVRFVETEEALNSYEQLAGVPHSHSLATRNDREGNGLARFVNALIVDDDAKQTSSVVMGNSMSLCLTIDSNVRIPRPKIGLILFDADGRRVFRLFSSDHVAELPPIIASTNKIMCRADSLPLAPGCYSISLIIKDSTDHLLDRIHDALRISVTPADVFGTGTIPCHGDLIYLMSRWTTCDTGESTRGIEGKDPLQFLGSDSTYR